MKQIYFIARRQLGSYFNSPVAYVVVVLFLLITGSLFWLTFFDDLNVLSLRGYFERTPLFLAFFAPAITMGSFATEKRSGTLELLKTMPVTDVQIVLGKFVAALALLAVVFAMTLPYPYTLSLLGELDWGAVAAGYIGVMLVGGAYTAIGLMASSWARDQVVAILVAFSLCILLYLIDQLAAPVTGTAATIVEYASTNYHFRSIARGVIEIRSVVYYLSVMTAALVITTLSIERQSW